MPTSVRGVPLRGAIPGGSELPRTSASSGPVALLHSVDRQHGAYLAVAVSDVHGGGAAAVASAGRIAGAMSALQLPADLMTNTAAAPPVAGPGGAEGPSLHLYAVTGLDPGDSVTSSLSCMHTHSAPLPFTAAATATTATSRSAARIVEKLLWAGPTHAVALNRLGELLLVATGISPAAAGGASSASDCDDEHGHSDVGLPAELHRFPRVVDVAACVLAAGSEAGPVPVVLMAGLRGVQAAVLAAEGDDAMRGRVPRLCSVCEWPLGPFTSLAALACAPSPRPDPAVGTVIFAGCSTAGLAQVFAWCVPRHRRDTAAAPVPLRQVLLGPGTSFLGVTAGLLEGVAVFAAVGVVPRVAGGATMGSASTVTASSLRGKDGRPLLVSSSPFHGEAEDSEQVWREPMNEAYALLQRRRGGVPEAGERRDGDDEQRGRAGPLHAVGPSVLIAPPNLALAARAEGQDVVLLTISVSVADADCAEAGGGGDEGRVRCATALRVLSADPTGAALVSRLDGHTRLLPTMPTVSAGGSPKDALGLVLHTHEAVVGFAVSSATGTAADTQVRPWVSHTASAGASKEQLVGVVCGGSGDGRRPPLLTIAGTVTVEAAERDSDRERGPPKVSITRLHVTTLPSQALAVEAAHRVGASGTIGEPAEALRQMVCEVVREESARIAARVEDRLARLEAKLDQLLHRLE